MTLELTLSVDRSPIPLGSEIPTRLTLKNAGDAEVEVASLFDNNTITNYVLSDASDRVIVRVNHVTRQRLREVMEPRTTDERPIRLAPGASEVRSDNFSLYHWIDVPGVYHLRGLYKWRDRELVTPPARFEITRAPLAALDAQWEYHYGEKFMLNSAWLAEVPAGGFELVLRKSLRFRPSVIQSNAPVFRTHTPIEPRVSFNRSLMGGGPVWVAWLEAGRFMGIRAAGGSVEAGPFAIAGVPRDGFLVGAPLLAADGALTCALGDAQRAEVVLLRLGADGTELGRSSIPLGVSGVRQLTALADTNGGAWLLATTDDPHRLYARAFDPDRLTLGPAELVGESPLPFAALLTPPVLGEEGYVVTLAVEGPEECLELTWWSVTDRSAEPAKRERLRFPGAGEILRVSGTLDARAQPYFLLRGRKWLRYLNGSIRQWLELGAGSALDPAGTEQLVVNQRGDVFLSMGSPGVGLRERRIHGGHEHDLSDWSESD